MLPTCFSRCHRCFIRGWKAPQNLTHLRGQYRRQLNSTGLGGKGKVELTIFAGASDAIARSREHRNSVLKRNDVNNELTGIVASDNAAHWRVSGDPRCRWRLAALAQCQLGALILRPVCFLAR